MKQIAWDEVMKRLEVASKICNDASPVQVEGPIHVGVDLGTADVVVMAVDDNGMPVSAFLEWATVVRDGVVVDYHGAITIVKRLVSMTEERLGRKITEASTSYPPGTDARLSTNILDAANLRLVSTADEPSCLARLARLDRAAVVDIGGGTTGTAVISNGKVIASVDDATGGHHVTLAMSGALSVPYEEAELKKRGTDNRQYAPIVKPVFERISDIVKAHISGHAVDTVYLTGGTCCFPGIAPLFEKELGIKVECPDYPLLLTPPRHRVLAADGRVRKSIKTGEGKNPSEEGFLLPLPDPPLILLRLFFLSNPCSRRSRLMAGWRCRKKKKGPSGFAVAGKQERAFVSIRNAFERVS